MVYPFSIDVHSARAHETLTRLSDALGTDVNTTAGSPPGYNGSHWLWTTALIATGFFFQQRADEGLALLKKAPNSIGPFFAPNEQMVVRDGRSQFVLPWFTTSAGAFVYALNAMIAYVTEHGTVLLNGVPESLMELRFTDLAGSYGTRISGDIQAGRISSLRVRTEKALRWIFFMPEYIVIKTTFTAICTVSVSAQHGLREVICDLEAGETELIVR